MEASCFPRAAGAQTAAGKAFPSHLRIEDMGFALLSRVNASQLTTKHHARLHAVPHGKGKQRKPRASHPYDSAEDALERVMPEEILHRMTARRLLEYLVAIVLGNTIYLLSVQPHLPASMHHTIFRIDWGLGLDFLICAAVYGAIRLGKRL
jgi:hypothetical protein